MKARFPKKPQNETDVTYRKTRRSLTRLLPVLIFAAIGLFILKQENDTANDWFDRTFHPEQWAAIDTCRRSALTESTQPSTARVIKRGKANKTQNGYLVEALLVGEMGADGQEQRYSFSCYVDGTGKLLNTHRGSAALGSNTMTDTLPQQEAH